MIRAAHLHITHQGDGLPIVLSHALGVDVSMWDEVAQTLSEHHAVVCFDHRGHGRSERVAGPYAMADLVEDAAQMIQSHFPKGVVFVGLSLGGMVGQLLAAEHPALVRRLVVANAPAFVPESAQAAWAQRIAAVEHGGMAAITPATLERWFTPDFRAQTSGVAAQRLAMVRASLLACDPQAYVASCHAVAGFDARAHVAQIQCPSLVIGGRWDEGTPLLQSSLLCDALPSARLAVLDTAHLSAVEQPEVFAHEVLQFLES
jgi:3-oxoadipate enol-lactonase